MGRILKDVSTNRIIPNAPIIVFLIRLGGGILESTVSSGELPLSGEQKGYMTEKEFEDQIKITIKNKTLRAEYYVVKDLMPIIRAYIGNLTEEEYAKYKAASKNG